MMTKVIIQFNQPFILNQLFFYDDVNLHSKQVIILFLPTRFELELVTLVWVLVTLFGFSFASCGRIHCHPKRPNFFYFSCYYLLCMKKYYYLTYAQLLSWYYFGSPVFILIFFGPTKCYGRC